MKLPEDIEVPPAPVVPPERALETFTLKPGFKIDLVAAEPLVNRPVDIAWDAQGRLWVAEMTNYMPDVDATGEKDPVGSIAVLEDTDGDSIMDKRTVFLDGLVLPRTVAPVLGGVLVGAPPSLLYCEDTDGDLVCDKQTVVDSRYGSVNGNVEHMTNVLRPGRDNWFVMGKDDRQYRFHAGGWKTRKRRGLGQWGISIDDWGRIYYNSNSNMLSADGKSVASNRVWPIRPTPGVNRGYQWIAKSDRLHSVTAACGPGVYRGGAFPEGFEGNVFVCAPCVNLVKRVIVEEADGKIRGEHAYQDSEFLASTDERFRPVNIRTGPDGGLYIVDMYHGILQHRTYVTTWLRQQILDRGLDKPMGTGRIYRILPEGVDPAPRPDLGSATTGGLIAALRHQNGWWRDTAQRLLVERGDQRAVPPLKVVLEKNPDPLTRFHALWTLEGLGAANAAVIESAIASEHPKLRESGMRIAVSTGLGDALAPQLAALIEDADRFVRERALAAVAASESPELAATFQKLLSRTRSEEVLKAAAAAADGREIEVLAERLADPNWVEAGATKGRAEFLSELTRRLLDRGRAAECDELVTLLDAEPAEGWRRQALIEGAISNRRAKDKKRRPVRLANAPMFAASLGAREREAIEKVFVWPGREGYVVSKSREFSLDSAQVAKLEEGKSLYNVACAVCHKGDGSGQEGLAPPLVGSEWVSGTYDYLARISLDGLVGPIEVAGRKYDLMMPPLGALEDSQLAAILSYVQRNFGDASLPPIKANELRAIRQSKREKKGMWTAEELEELKTGR